MKAMTICCAVPMAATVSAFAGRIRLSSGCVNDVPGELMNK